MEKKMKAIIIDDEKNGIEMLEYLLEKNCNDVEIVATFLNPKQAVKEIPILKPDVIFLDIDMPGMNGFELLQNLTPFNFQVVFTTAYNEYAIDAFKVNAVDYLLKPIETEELKDAVNKVAKMMHNQNDMQPIENILAYIQAAQGINKISIPTDDGVIFSLTESILYFKADGGYTEVYFTNGKKLFTSKLLGDYEDGIATKGFFRIHNSYIINLRHIEKFVKSDGGYVVMQDGTNITVSRRRKDDFMKVMGG